MEMSGLRHAYSILPSGKKKHRYAPNRMLDGTQSLGVSEKKKIVLSVLCRQPSLVNTPIVKSKL